LTIAEHRQGDGHDSEDRADGAELPDDDPVLGITLETTVKVPDAARPPPQRTRMAPLPFRVDGK
jgi:hypothetical protein